MCREEYGHIRPLGSGLDESGKGQEEEQARDDVHEGVSEVDEPIFMERAVS